MQPTNHERHARPCAGYPRQAASRKAAHYAKRRGVDGRDKPGHDAPWLNAPDIIHRERIAGMLENYSFISDDVMAYFKRRLSQAPKDADFALDYIKKHAKTRAEQDACVNAVKFKCNVLWAQLDALHHAYVNGLIPPGAFVPKG